jgi:ATP-binding cassette subfamily B protein
VRDQPARVPGTGLGSLAFNLLLARHWPPRPGDIKRAAAVCRELGLGPLIDRIPRAWNRSSTRPDGSSPTANGASSTSPVACSQTPQVILLDQSFGALDPATLQHALRCVLGRHATLLVISQ